jgi:4-amino-4-deoxy-L-arabinose transferase-like glycosyltransferase
MHTQAEPASSTRLLSLSATQALATVLLAIVFFGLIRYRLCDLPLERDEGEYAYSGQLLLQEIPPYKLAYNMKLPGIYVAYACTMAALGQTRAGIHLGLLLVNAATVLVLYFLTLKLFAQRTAAVAACSYALLSTSRSVMGFEAHATNFVVLPALIGILLLLYAQQSGRARLFFWSGLFSGVAFLMKQHGIFFILFCLFYLAWTERSKHAKSRTIFQHAAVFGAGTALPYAATCWLLYRAGVFRQFWFWTVSYAGEYSKVGMHRAVRAFLENSRAVVTPAFPIWILAFVGLSALLWSTSARRHSSFILGLFLFSFLSLCPGAYFRPHYFILMLPATAILAGIAVDSATDKMAGYSNHWHLVLIPTMVFLVAFGYSIFEQRRVYFSMFPPEVSQEIYGMNAFVPAKQVADYIRNNSSDSARIAVLGSEPEIYFYAKRHSATGYIYMYSLIGRQKYTARMREEMMRELEENRPDYVVYVDVWDSWGDRDGGPQLAEFLAGLQKYRNENYETVGVADIGERTEYLWGNVAQNYKPHSSSVIYILKRKPLLQSRDAAGSAVCAATAD